MVRIGIDLGGTNIVAGIVDEQHNILSKENLPTNLPRPAQNIIDDIALASHLALEKAGLTLADVEGIGIGCPGTCNIETGLVEYSCNLDFNNVPLITMMTERLNKPTFFGNDANVAALGEAIAGAGKDAESLICITLGTGVGGGIVINKHIITGFNYAGAELGHIVIVKDGVPCTCGRNGCWESYASATALIRQTKQAIADNPDSLLAHIAAEDGGVSGRTAFNAKHAGCPVAAAVVDNYIGYVACGLTDMVNIFQPEILCIGGGISNEGEALIQPIRAYVERERYSKISARQTHICKAMLGNDAGIIGAAALCL